MEIIEQSCQEHFLRERQHRAQQEQPLDSTLFSLKLWWNKVQCAQSFQESIDTYELGLFYLPGCYKLWSNYLLTLQSRLGPINGIHLVLKQNSIQAINSVFERSLLFLHKMPRIWLMYGSFLAQQGLITRTRAVYDRALEALPVSQHEKIWAEYTKWLFTVEPLESIKSTVERYLQFRPDFKEQLVEVLIQREDYGSAVYYMQEIIDDDQFVSESNQSKYEVLLQMCQLISKWGGTMQSIDCEAVIRHGIRKYTDEVGNLWVCLVEYWLRQGLFDKARDVFEEALTSIYTVRDFGVIFNSYVRFEEQMVDMLDYQCTQHDTDQALAAQIDRVLNIDTEQTPPHNKDHQMAFRMERLENLLQRRPILINNCLLRKNRHNVKEWLNRFALLQNEQQALIQSFGEALTQIDIKQAVQGSVSQVWLYIAQYYRQQGDVQNSNAILFKAVTQPFTQYQDFLSIWRYWVETLLDSKHYGDALVVLKKALFSQQASDESIRLSVDLWALYADLEMNLGSAATLHSTYQKMLDLKVITPLITINYVDSLEQMRHYEQSYKVLEQALGVFSTDSNYMLFAQYLYKFVARHEGRKVERARDLFEKALHTHPTKKLFYLMYGQFEEQYGLINHAIEVYDRMTRHLVDKLGAYQFYVAKVGQYLGVTKTRPVFQKAMAELTGDHMVEMGLKYSALELRLGEIDRARAIFTHTSQYVSILDDSLQLWPAFEQFEKTHGNVDTYKDFLRLKRAVTIKFSLNPPDVARILQKIKREEQEEQA